jgi:hypothetical protein
VLWHLCMVFKAKEPEGGTLGPCVLPLGKARPQECCLDLPVELGGSRRGRQGLSWSLS